jgi:hypothetical protein
VNHLIFAPNWLGGAVIALPAIADVRRGSRDDRRRRERRRAAVQMVGDVDDVIVPAGWPDRWRQADVAIRGSFRAALSAARAGIPAMGLSARFGAACSRAIRSRAGRHPSDRLLPALVQALGFPAGGCAAARGVSGE